MREEALTTEGCKTTDSGQGMERYFFRASAADFKKIPGSPIAYWVSKKVGDIFLGRKIDNVAKPRVGMTTGDNDRFLRLWWEVNCYAIFQSADNCVTALSSGKKWFPANKGGEYRKWFGNNANVVNWENDGEEILASGRAFARSRDFYFQECITWSAVSSSYFGFRFSPHGFIPITGGSCAYASGGDLQNEVLPFLSSKVAVYFLRILSSTLNIEAGDLSRLPLVGKKNNDSKILIISEKYDWDSYETSWDFTTLPLLRPDYHRPTLKATYQNLRTHWQEMTLEMQRLEEENNRIFIEAYGLQDELTPEVPLKEITLTCNPHYRFGSVASDQGLVAREEELESRLLTETMKELVSYAVGCMFGRYSLDMPGLVLANQGETLVDYLRKVADYRQTLATSHSPLATKDSEQWPVASKEGEIYAGEKLQGSDRVAESHGSGAVSLSSNQDLPQGGTVRLDQSDTAGSSLDSIQHSGGTSASIVSGVQELSVNSTGFSSGGRNSATDSQSPELSNTRTTSPNHGSPSGNQQNDSGADGKTGHWPLDTSHLSFVPDEDNVIPLLDGDWFTDDITERFKQFLKVAFGAGHYEENLRFVEAALNLKGKRNYTLRDYFLSEFYTDHLKRYKKRPIYWLFSSSKGSFQALIYLHRYRPDTVSVVLNDYLREFRTKLTSHKNHLEAVSISASASQGEKTKALKEIEKITKMIVELEEYEREVLYPLAIRQVEIDLDDGVKVNYPKLGAALKKIVGLDAAED